LNPNSTFSVKTIWAAIAFILVAITAGIHYLPPAYQQWRDNQKAAADALLLPPTLNLPEKINAAIGKHIDLIPLMSDADRIEWLTIDSSVEILPVPGSTNAIAVASKPGMFMVYAIGIKNGNLGKFQQTRVVVTDTNPSPPTPIPAQDPLVQALSDTIKPEEMSYVKQLAEGYNNLAATNSVKTVGDAYIAARKMESKVFLAEAALPKFMDVIFQEQSRSLGSNYSSAVSQDELKTVFGKLSKALDQLK
jgi:hypothetical protein